MAINYKNPTVEHCRFVHQEKEFGEQGYFCNNNAQFKIKVSDDYKIFDFDLCPRHERILSKKESFKYCDKILKIIK